MLKMFSMIHIGERAGSGIPGIVDTWKKVFHTKPEYEQKYSPSRVKMVLDISEFVEESSDKVTINEESSEKSSEKIIELIKNDPNISAAAIAEQIGLSSRAVEKQLKKLRDENLIRRIGPDKGGYWEIVKSD